MKNIVCLIMVFTMVAACKSTPECPTIAPWRTSTESLTQSVVLDPDVQRIFKTSSTQKPPANIQWSSDGKTVALLETTPESPDSTRLWLVDVKKKRKRPVFLGRNTPVKAPVKDFVWINDHSLAVRTEKKVLRATVDGKVSDTAIGAANISRMTPSPDGEWLAYTRDNNLFVYSFSGKKEKQLSDNTAKDVCSGCISWLYEEEFKTENGFQWSPDSRRIWLREVDQQAVEKETVALLEPGKTEVIPYSHPGKNNPVVTIKVVSVSDDSNPEQVLPLRGDNDWYLTDAMWHPEKSAIMVMRMDRLQTRLELHQCDLSADSHCDLVFSHTDPRWVNYPGPPIFTPDKTKYALPLERENFAQIYLFDAGTHESRQLTNGDFPVREIVAIDNTSVTFTASVTDPLNVGIHKALFADGKRSAITDSPGVHSPVFAPSHSEHPHMFVDTFSKVDVSPAVNLCDGSGKPVYRIDNSEPTAYRPSVDVINEFDSIGVTDDLRLYVHITRPKITGDKKYPALVYVYGGPGYQAVSNRFSTTFTAWRDMMAKRGFVIFTIDNRGSAGRGREFETVIHRNLNAVALEDQLLGVRWLKKQPYVNPNRLGIIGWSFGGTIALNALLATEKLFRLGVAIAPVTDWRRYDTAYTERYMQRPDDNPENYEATDLTQQTAALTEKLLLVHGTGDRNVLVSHSMALAAQAARNGRHIETIFYPGMGHSIDDQKLRTHLFSAVTKFIEKNL